MTSTWRRLTLAALACLVVLSAAPAPAQAPSRSADPLPRLDQLPSHDLVQRDLPGRGRASQGEEADPETERGGRPDAGELDSGTVATLLMIGEILQWVVLAGVVFLLVRFLPGLVRDWRFRGRKKTQSVSVSAASTPASPPAPAAPPGTPPDHAALAAEGRFSDAVHAAFLHALHVVGAARVARGATSRQIIAGLSVEPALRRALQDLGRLSDGIVFGGHTADADLYELAREHLQRTTGEAR